ncbi:MAG TPA: SEC-C metal-binding domain-containing protein [Gaiellales bacterium]
MSGLIDSGWAAWLPQELVAAMEALDANAAGRRAFAKRLAEGPDAAARERWDRFALAAPSRIDVPASADGLTPEDCYALLAELGLAAGDPPRAVANPEPVELVLTLDHDELRELERVRMARDAGEPSTPVDALPSLEARFGGAKVGRNDPCPCGSGKKFKRCHGS